MKRLCPFRHHAAALLLSLVAATSGFSATASADVLTGEYVPPALPVIPVRVFKLTDFGAVANARTLNTAAFKKAIAAIEKAGGGKLVVPPGVFRTAPFTLCSNLELHLEAGAVVQAPDTFEALGLPNPASFKTQTDADVSKTPDPLITGRNLHDVAITGTGTIDGSGAPWWAWSERAARNAAAGGRPGRVVLRRSHLVAFDDVQRLLIADVTLANSPMVHLVARQVTDLTVERVKIRAPLDSRELKTSAITAESVTRAWIHHCDFDTRADSIVIKTGGTGILIEDCAIKEGRGISIGPETTAGVNSILVRRCTFEGTDHGIRTSSTRGAGGLVENVRYTELTMKNVPNPIVLQLDYVDNDRPGFQGNPTKTPSMRNITIDHVTVEGAQNAGIFHGLLDSVMTGITLRDVRITAENDFDVKDADEPLFERVSTMLIAAAPREKAKPVE